MSDAIKRQTGPLSPQPPRFETTLTPPSTDKNLRDALLMLDAIEEYCKDPDYMLRELKFNFGYDDAEAAGVMRKWEQMK